jgi:hypothetical protein
MQYLAIQPNLELTTWPKQYLGFLPSIIMLLFFSVLAFAVNTNLRVRINTDDLLIKLACFVKKKCIISVFKAGVLNYLVQGG